MTRRLLLLLVAGGLAVAGCASSKPAATSTPPSTVHTVGAEPSKSSQMVCSEEAQTDIAASIGVKATVSAPTWAAHVYECKYAYPSGTITLSVKEHSNAAETTATYDAFAKQLGRRPEVVSFGEGAFITTNGSVVVRKDYLVLDIDVSKIPQRFGQPLQDRSDVALSIAATVMSCWTGE